MRLAIATLFLVLSACTNQSSMSAEQKALADAENAAIVAAAMADVAAAESTNIPTGGEPTNPEAENTVKAVINLNGQLCAEIVKVRPLATPDMAEVTCIEYTGGKSKVTYEVNLNTAEVKLVK